MLLSWFFTEREANTTRNAIAKKRAVKGVLKGPFVTENQRQILRADSPPLFFSAAKVFFFFISTYAVALGVA